MKIAPTLESTAMVGLQPSSVFWSLRRNQHHQDSHPTNSELGLLVFWMTVGECPLGSGRPEAGFQNHLLKAAQSFHWGF